MSTVAEIINSQIQAVLDQIAARDGSDCEYLYSQLQKLATALTTANGSPAPVPQSINYTDVIPVRTWNNTPMSSPFTGPPISPTDPRWGEEIDFGTTVRGFYLYLDDLRIRNVSNQNSFYLEAYCLIDGAIRRFLGLVYSNGDRLVSLPFLFNHAPFSRCKFFIDFLGLEPIIINGITIAEDLRLRAANSAQFMSNWRYPLRTRFDLSRVGAIGHLVALGAMGMLTGFDPVSDSIAYDWGGYTLSVGQKVRLWGTPSASFTPPPGISYLIEARQIDRITNTLVVRGSIPPVLGKLLRLRLLSGTLSGLSSGSLVTFSEAAQTTANTWLVKLSAANGNLLNIVDTGSSRWAYLSYLDTPDLTVLDGNKLSLNGTTPLDLFNEVQDFAATITAGTPTQITWTAHGRSVGDRLTLGISSPAGSLPGNVNPQNNVVYVHSIVDANTIRVCAYPNTPPVNLGTAGSGVTATPDNGTTSTITVSPGTSATIASSLHGLIVGAKIALGGTTLPSGYSANAALYAQAVTGNNITPSAMPGGLPIAFLSAGSGVTLSGTNTAIDFCPIALSQYWLTAGSSGGEFDLRPTESGTPFALTSAAASSITLRVLDPPTVESGSAVVFGFA